MKGLGFSPSNSAFGIALHAKCAMSKSLWDEKVGVFKKWGWSDENILEAFRRHPSCMLASCGKINVLVSFRVNQMGWDALALVKGANLFGFSMEKWIISRAFVVRYLLAKGLMNEKASILTPSLKCEHMFLQRFVTCFSEEETSQLLKLYRQKMSLQDNRANGCIHQLTHCYVSLSLCLIIRLLHLELPIILLNCFICSLGTFGDIMEMDQMVVCGLK